MNPSDRENYNKHYNHRVLRVQARIRTDYSGLRLRREQLLKISIRLHMPKATLDPHIVQINLKANLKLKDNLKLSLNLNYFKDYHNVYNNFYTTSNPRLITKCLSGTSYREVNTQPIIIIFYKCQNGTKPVYLCVLLANYSKGPST